MDLAYNALDSLEARSRQAETWRNWWASVADGEAPAQVLILATAERLDHRLRAVRALGSLGGRQANRTATHVFQALRHKDYDSLEPLEKQLGQACIRSLGRLRDPASLPLLVDLLQSPGWARFAADALGDCGRRAAVGPLLAAYPRFSRKLENPLRRPELCPADDRFAGDNTQDRMFETPYAIAQALVRLPLDDPGDLAALSEIVPFVLANLPSDWDGGMLYERESFERVTAYLLDRASLRKAACAAAFQAADRPDKWIQARDFSIDSSTLSAAELIKRLAIRTYGDVPYMAAWLPALCQEQHLP